MFLVVDRDEQRVAALAAALAERGVEARAFRTPFEAGVAAADARPAAVLASLDASSSMDLSALGGMAPQGGWPLLLYGGPPGRVYRAFCLRWFLGVGLRWCRGESPPELAAWAIAQASIPDRQPRLQNPWLLSAICFTGASLSALMWARLSPASALPRIAMLLTLLVFGSLAFVGPVVTAMRRRIPVSLGGWLAAVGFGAFFAYFTAFVAVL